jgi:hypothetical protein
LYLLYILLFLSFEKYILRYFLIPFSVHEFCQTSVKV